MPIAGVIAMSHYYLVKMVVIVDTVARLNLDFLTGTVAAFDWPLGIGSATDTDIFIFKTHGTIINSLNSTLSTH